MSKAANTRFTFKEELTSIDYQKIMIEQNQTIIQLLMMQAQDNNLNLKMQLESNLLYWN